MVSQVTPGHPIFTKKFLGAMKRKTSVSISCVMGFSPTSVVDLSPTSFRWIILCILQTLLTIFAAEPSNAQVVNIESQRIQSDSNGLLGSVSANLALSSNAKTVIVADASAQVEYKRDLNLFLLLGSYGLVTGNSEDFFNNAFAHLRYNRK